ncbi:MULTISPECIES: head GIN domain-containing protein [Aquimarina]|nr:MULTISPECIES: head GIN domain-containing protein [Aquimarina]
MAKISLYLAALLISVISMMTGYSQSKTISVDHFDNVIVSPHIQVHFKEGNSEKVTIDNARLPEDKINIEVIGRTLRIYLDDAKMTTKHITIKENGWKRKVPIYKGTMITATVTYTQLKELSIRGEEIITCESPIERDDFRLKMYGEGKMTMNAVKLNSLQVSIYGESYLEIKEGVANNQKYTVYGEGEINTLGMSNENTKITAYGESHFRVNVSDRLKVTAFGETTVAYNGNPTVNKGIVLGEATIQKMN